VAQAVARQVARRVTFNPRRCHARAAREGGVEGAAGRHVVLRRTASPQQRSAGRVEYGRYSRVCRAPPSLRVARLIRTTRGKMRVCTRCGRRAPTRSSVSPVHACREGMDRGGGGGCASEVCASTPAHANMVGVGAHVCTAMVCTVPRKWCFFFECEWGRVWFHRGEPLSPSFLPIHSRHSVPA